MASSLIKRPRARRAQVELLNQGTANVGLYTCWFLTRTRGAYTALYMLILYDYNVLLSRRSRASRVLDATGHALRQGTWFYTPNKGIKYNIANTAIRFAPRNQHDINRRDSQQLTSETFIGVLLLQYTLHQKAFARFALFTANKLWWDSIAIGFDANRPNETRI